MSDQERLVAGRYRLAERIGQGGMGTVWRAEDEVLGRQVALKQLHLQPHLFPDELGTLYERMRREARSAARVAHPNVIVVHDVVEDDGRPCIVMEYVPGSTLGDLLRGGRTVPPGEAARVGLGMVAALRAAHGAGVLHRDVKPGNVLLGAGDRVVLTDFGIAMTAGASTLTKTGEMVGSIDYMAPERVRGRTPGPASDLWALGATLYQAVEGRPPFRRATAMETAYAIAVDPLEPVRQAGSLGPLIEALLARDPDERPSSQETEQALRAARAGETPAQLTSAFTSGAAVLPPASLSARADGHPQASGATGPWRAHTGAHEHTDGHATDPGHDHTDRHATAAQSMHTAAPPGRTRRPASGAGPVPPVTPPAAAPARAAGRGRRRVRTGVVAVTLAAALAAGVALYGTLQPGADTRDDHATRRADPPSPVPEGYHLVRDAKLGVSFPVPDGWKARDRTADEVTYADPSGLAGITIGTVAPAGSDPAGHFADIEANTKVNYSTYRRLRMQRTTFRGQPAAVWEFTFKGRARLFRAIDLGYGREGGREYDIYLSAPEAQWDTYRPVFDQVRDGFSAA